MKLLKAVVCFATVAAGLASAADKYTITLSRPATVAGTALKAGDYKVTVDGDKATISNGKSSVQAAVKVENADRKYSSTAVRFATSGEQYTLDEIHVGGTKTKLVFDSGSQAAVR
jgi:hypothetical protein